jgi:hypothetical protein
VGEAWICVCSVWSISYGHTVADLLFTMHTLGVHRRFTYAMSSVRLPTCEQFDDNGKGSRASGQIAL